MALKIGDKIPFITLSTMTSEGVKSISTDELFKSKTVAVFGVPGAFTPTCTAKHLPGYVRHGKKIKEKGIDTIVCISVNDPFVMGAWGESQNVGDIVKLVADGSAKFTKAAGLELDLTERGFGIRCQRFAMIVSDCVIQSIHIDPSGEYGATSAEAILGEISKKAT